MLCSQHTPVLHVRSWGLGASFLPSSWREGGRHAPPSLKSTAELSFQPACRVFVYTWAAYFGADMTFAHLRVYRGLTHSPGKQRHLSGVCFLVPLRCGAPGDLFHLKMSVWMPSLGTPYFRGRGRHFEAPWPPVFKPPLLLHRVALHRPPSITSSGDLVSARRWQGPGAQIRVSVLFGAFSPGCKWTCPAVSYRPVKGLKHRQGYLGFLELE